jgi:acyl-CoA synthetase (AMP-forming)/AMP-acid ligase II
MLYEQWCKIAAERRDALALRDLASDRRLTFGELHAAGEAYQGSDGSIAYPQGNSPGFLLALLSAWRMGKVVCPLEPEQSAPQVPQPPRRCVHLKFTSATTGAPRLVAFTGEQLAADAANIIVTMGLRPDWPNLSAISLAHSYGFSNLVLPLLLHGIPLVLVPSPLPEAVRRAAEGEPAITLAAVPALWRAWHEAKAIPPNVQLAISAGAPLPAGLEQAIFKSSALKIHNFYGSTECGGITYDATDTPRADDACVGAPMRNVALSLNEDGCLVVRSRAVGETYWPQPAETLGSGQFQTSDLVELEEGVVYLRGRASDQINVAGRKVSPASIEKALMEHPALDACLVFGAPGRNGDRADLIVACVVAKSPVTSETLRQFMLERVPAWQMPRDWWFVDSLATNRLAKVSRVEWRRRYLKAKNGNAAIPGISSDSVS